MTLGIFLLVIFGLWLIDKHKLWLKALKASLILAVIGILGLIALLIRDEQNAKRFKAEQRAEQLAEETAKRTQLANCIKRMATPPPVGSTLQVDAQSTCEQDPDATSTSTDPKWYKMQASDGKWYKTLASSSQEARNKIEGPASPPQKPHRVHHLLARLDADLHTTEFGSLVCAHVTRGETVTLLQDDSSWVRVKTQSGKTGWGDSEYFEVMD